MEVDRVSQMGGVGQEGQTAWSGTRAKRRKFVEELPEPESDTEEEPEPSADNNREGGLDVLA
jgi:hypothetical protein